MREAARIEIGGAIEESEKGNASINKLFPLMIIGMLTLLMIQLQSFSRLVLVFLTAPLGIVGASLGLNVAGSPFRFVDVAGGGLDQPHPGIWGGSNGGGLPPWPAPP